jgi:hypothetical protein
MVGLQGRVRGAACRRRSTEAMKGDVWFASLNAILSEPTKQIALWRAMRISLGFRCILVRADGRSLSTERG